LGDASVVVDSKDNLVVSTLKENASSTDWFATRLQGGGFADLVGGKLRIYGSTDSDNISVSASGSLVNVSVNGKSKSFTKSQISSIAVNGYGSADIINISKSVTINVTAD